MRLFPARMPQKDAAWGITMVLYLIVTILALAAARLVLSPDPLPGRLFHADGAAQRRRPAFDGRSRRTRAEACSRIAMALLFTALFLPLALRVNTGNDYAKYVDFMHLIRSHAYVPTEAGFNAFVRAVYALSGFENYLLVFALIAAATLALFLAAIWQQADDFAASFFLFMMLGYYFQTYNTVRYYFALSLVLFASGYLLRREFAPFVVLVLLAALFHKSALLALLLYPVAALPWKKWVWAAGAVLSVSFPLFQNFWLRVVVKLYPSYEDTEYLAGSGINPTNIARCCAVLLLAAVICLGGKMSVSGGGKTVSLYDLYEETPGRARQERFWFHLTVMALALYVCCSFLPIISRIGYYLTLPQIFYIPRLLRRLQEGGTARRRLTGRVFTVLTVLAAVLYFALFLGKLSRPELRILPYHTFLFTDMPKTLSQMSD